MKRGRPSTYTPELAAEICARLSAGEGLDAICESDDRFPPESTVRGWDLDDREGFSAIYARARKLGIDALVERGMKVAADRERDPNCRRVELDAIKWFASKLRPEKYGDRTALELGGPGGSELKVTIRSVLDDEKPG